MDCIFSASPNYYFEHSVSKETQADIKKNGIPFGLWTQYDERYNYRIVPQFYKDDSFDDLHPSYFNGEEDYFHKEDLKQQTYLKKALPFRMNIGFIKYNFSAVFDWKEIHEVFKTLTKNDKQAKIDIIAKVGFEYNSMTFSAKCGDIIIPLPSTTGEMHSNE